MPEQEWNDHQPIYRQLRDQVVAMILDGLLKEGDPAAFGPHRRGGVSRQSPHRPQELPEAG